VCKGRREEEKKLKVRIVRRMTTRSDLRSRVRGWDGIVRREAGTGMLID
jgi:hypothetical protein